jgi:hypothetical protein
MHEASPDQEQPVICVGTEGQRPLSLCCSISSIGPDAPTLRRSPDGIGSGPTPILPRRSLKKVPMVTTRHASTGHVAPRWEHYLVLAYTTSRVGGETQGDVRHLLRLTHNDQRREHWPRLLYRTTPLDRSPPCNSFQRGQVDVSTLVAREFLHWPRRTQNPDGHCLESG